MDLHAEIERTPVLADVCAARETVWINPGRSRVPEGWPEQTPWGDGLTIADVRDAEARLERFAPLIRRLFPETEASGGIIESELREIPAMARELNVETPLLLKLDSHLPVAGSVKARGGIYEVLCHTERLAMEAGLLRTGDSYERLAEPDCRAFFARHRVQVGSTGNLGMSIGIMSAALGFHAVVHMSHDAKQWKKEKLRACGVEVREYASDYSLAVQEGRRLSEADSDSYFVDDENSRELFLGYAVAGLRLKRQLADRRIRVDAAHPLAVYIPCGVGGAPGGITFGLRCAFGDDVHVFFVEPTQAPCMLCGMATGLDSAVCVQDFGLTGRTEADGLAVGRPSAFVGRVMRPHVSGIFTASDDTMRRDLRRLFDTEGIFLEPSACAGFAGVAKAEQMKDLSFRSAGAAATQIVWATGGGMVPADVRAEYLRRV